MQIWKKQKLILLLIILVPYSLTLSPCILINISYFNGAPQYSHSPTVPYIVLFAPQHEHATTLALF